MQQSPGLISAINAEVREIKCAFFLIGSRERLFQVANINQVLYVNGKPTYHMIYYLSKYCEHEFLVSIAGFKSSTTQHDVHSVH